MCGRQRWFGRTGIFCVHNWLIVMCPRVFFFPGYSLSVGQCVGGECFVHGVLEGVQEHAFFHIYGPKRP